MLIKYILLGVLQGLTEFLPVSSSGHLVIAKVYSKLPGDMAFDVVLHLASALAIIIYFHKEIYNLVKAVFRGLYNLLRRDFKALSEDSWFCLGLFIVIASVPAGVAGVFLEDRIESLFSSDLWAGAFLILTGFILFSSRWAEKHAAVNENDNEVSGEGEIGEKKITPVEKTAAFKEITLSRALLIGFFQALAILPGISRSGTTITTGMWAGLSREQSGRFSFLLGLPAILGAGILKISSIASVSGEKAWAYAAGAAFSFIVSFAALVVLFKILKTKYFSWFSIYCWGAGLAIIVLKIF
jgi:undecaprenyl-diphosphatase